MMGLPDEPKKPRCKAFDPRYDQQRKSKKQETRFAKKVGGRRQIGSGNRNIRKGDAGTATGMTARGRDFRPADINHDKFLFEAKRTDAKRITIEGAWLLKICAEAESLGKLPAITWEIGGLTLVEKDWVAVPASIFNALLDKEDAE